MRGGKTTLIIQLAPVCHANQHLDFISPNPVSGSKLWRRDMRVKIACCIGCTNIVTERSAIDVF